MPTYDSEESKRICSRAEQARKQRPSHLRSRRGRANVIQRYEHLINNQNISPAALIAALLRGPVMYAPSTLSRLVSKFYGYNL